MILEAEAARERAQRLQGKVAIVTRARGGVGHGIARRLAVNGATVVAGSHDEARAAGFLPRDQRHTTIQEGIAFA